MYSGKLLSNAHDSLFRLLHFKTDSVNIYETNEGYMEKAGIVTIS